MIKKLVMLPGMDGTGELFADFVEALPDRFEVEVVRYPTNVCLSYTELMTFVQSAAPGSEPFVLIAESFSPPPRNSIRRDESTKFESPDHLCRIRYNPASRLASFPYIAVCTFNVPSGTAGICRQVACWAQCTVSAGDRRASRSLFRSAESVVGPPPRHPYLRRAGRTQRSRRTNPLYPSRARPLGSCIVSSRDPADQAPDRSDHNCRTASPPSKGTQTNRRDRCEIRQGARIRPDL